MLLFVCTVTVNLLMADFLDTVLEEGENFDEILNSHSPIQTCVPLAFQNSVTTPPLKLPLKRHPVVKRQKEKTLMTETCLCASICCS